MYENYFENENSSRLLIQVLLRQKSVFTTSHWAPRLFHFRSDFHIQSIHIRQKIY